MIWALLPFLSYAFCFLAIFHQPFVYLANYIITLYLFNNSNLSLLSNTLTPARPFFFIKDFVTVCNMGKLVNTFLKNFICCDSSPCQSPSLLQSLSHDLQASPFKNQLLLSAPVSPIFFHLSFFALHLNMDMLQKFSTCNPWVPIFWSNLLWGCI